MAHWISVADFVEVAGISVQAARTALRQALAGEAWRGHALTVRGFHGSGGRGGRRFEVDRASLPIDLQAKLESKPERVGSALRTSSVSGPEQARLKLLGPALATKPASAERSVAIAAAADASGRSPRTLYRWLQRYEDHGLRGLDRKRNANAGRARVRVSRPFDRAWLIQGGGEDDLEVLAQDLMQALKGLWASRAEQAGGAEIRRLAEFLLLELTEARGLKLPPEATRLSRRTVDRFVAYRVVNQRRNDRKAYSDARPRIRRDWTQLAPMERVVADVKHLDVLVRRDDGTTAWPKIVAFLDAGTGRVFIHPVLLERGEGVRQEHVIEAFLAMVADPIWGFPTGLYLDNGSEFGALAKIDHALQLLNAPGARTLICAQPYNASAKPIESLFARLDRQAICLLPGYAGPNRMAQKVQTVGKPVEPYPGLWEEFCGVLQGLIAAQNLRAVGGLWQNRAPDDWFRQKHAQGWRPATVDPLSLDAAFADPDSRRVDRGIVKVQGQRFTHAKLAALPSRTVVDLALPWRRGASPLARIDGEWVILEQETAISARWIEGAYESSRRKQAQDRHVKALAKAAPAIDPVDIKLRWARRTMEPPQKGRSAASDLGGELRHLGSALAPVPDDPKPSAELRRLREMAMTELLEREQRRK
ncbi:MAG: helix-turn-helix domain-containing protein [Phenylobacterium sp.]|nr:helix-turn-helix domain-containing protein [Phenylobacterium sp.]